MTSDIPLLQPSLVTPPRWKGEPFHAEGTAVLAATLPDLRYLCRRIGIDPGAGRPLYTGRCIQAPGSWTLVGPFIGAPHAVMLVETLAFWGVRRMVFFGWCGALLPEIEAGDVVLPEFGLSDEGTSRHYADPCEVPAGPSSALQADIAAALGRAGLALHRGPVCSTDAIFRETPEQIGGFLSRGAIAVDMEVCAVLTAGRALAVDVGALLLVSDTISADRWRPGFAAERFRTARHSAGDAVIELCESPWTPTSNSRSTGSGGS